MKTAMTLAAIVSAGAVTLIMACCAQRGAPEAQNAAPPATGAAELSDADLAKMTPHELAQYVFEHDGCNSCHMLGANGQLSFTARGRQTAQRSEGCVALMTAVSAASQKPQAETSSQT